jgi:hypothetical protein
MLNVELLCANQVEKAATVFHRDGFAVITDSPDDQHRLFRALVQSSHEAVPPRQRYEEFSPRARELC